MNSWKVKEVIVGAISGCASAIAVIYLMWTFVDIRFNRVDAVFNKIDTRVVLLEKLSAENSLIITRLDERSIHVDNMFKDIKDDLKTINLEFKDISKRLNDHMIDTSRVNK